MPCIIHESNLTAGGYAQIQVNGKPTYRHRLAYEAVHGPLGDLTIHHLCGVRNCLNVEHMEAASRRDHAGKAGHGKLGADDAEKIRELRQMGFLQRDVADLYGLSRAYVSQIENGLRWAY